MKKLKRIGACLMASLMVFSSVGAPGFTLSAHAEQETKQSDQLWQAIAFGQSTDINFSSTILDEKIGTNYVFPYDPNTGLADAKPLSTQSPELVQDVAIESRGGKIQTGHDGLTFYYTEIPTTKNFVLTGTITVEQMGPENGANPNMQEGCGLMVRDVIGGPRQDPLLEGYEEYPAASNMAAIWVDSASKSKNADLMISTLARYGVDQKAGSNSAKRASTKLNWLSGLDLAKATDSNAASSDPEFADLTESNIYDAKMTLQLERTDESFIIRMKNPKTGNWNEYNYNTAANVNSNIVQNIDNDNMYVGFWASRNARMTVEDISLELIEANTIDAPQYKAEFTESASIYGASGEYTNSENYNVQALANFDGTAKVTQDGVVIADKVEVTGGEQFVVPTKITGGQSEFIVDFTADDSIITTGKRTASYSFSVNKENYPKDIYVSPRGAAGNTGSQENPMDLTTAIKKLVPGGTIYMAEGTYGYVQIDMKNAGSEDGRKAIKPLGKVKITEDTAAHYLFKLDSDYWDIEGLEIDGQDIVNSRGLYIYGSNNTIRYCTVHNTKSDAGLCITQSRSSRSLWPSNNLVEYCESYENVDESGINADGFASKSGSGDNNIFRYCVSHNNADDGWDLYNTLSGGENGKTIIENSIAYGNGNNGFKLGGESLPVQHEIRNSIAYKNGLDGFTDNFNPGELLVENNTSYDNVRFNYIFRPSPYILDENNTITANGTYKNNVSYRSTFESDKYDTTYDDKIFGKVKENNYLIVDDMTELTADDFVSLDETKAYSWIDGKLVFGDFLRASADSILSETKAGATFEEKTEPTPDPTIDEALKEALEGLKNFDAMSKEEQKQQVEEAVNLLRNDALDYSEITINSTSTLNDLAKIEDYILKAYSLETPKVDTTAASTIKNMAIKGAQLNLPIGMTGYVKVENTSVPAKKPQGFENLVNATAVDMKLYANGITSPINIVTPITITMDLPEKLVASDSIAVLHYSDSNSNGESIRYTIKDGKLSFTATSFSTFVIAAKSSGGSEPNKPGNDSGSGGGSSSAASQGKWIQDEIGWWYKNTNGSYAKNAWSSIGGKWYYFNAEGYMETGWVLVGGKWYYLQPQGHMVANDWMFYNNQWYYLNESGSMLQGEWLLYKENHYYFDANGAMLTNTTTPDGFTVNESGIWVK